MSNTTITSADIEQGTRPEIVAYLKSVQAYSGHSRDGLPALRDHAVATFNRLRYADGAEQAEATIERAAMTARMEEAIARQVPDPTTDPVWQPETLDDRAADCDAEKVAKASAAIVAAKPEAGEASCTPAPEVLEDRAERLSASKAEHQAMTAWVAGGKVGDRPATPNLDAMNEAYAAGTPLRKKARKGNGGAGRQVAPRRAEANAIAAKGKRGAGRKVTEPELRLYIATVMAEHPEATGNDELEYAYWVERLAVSRARWNTAWAYVAAAGTEAVQAAEGADPEPAGD